MNQITKTALGLLLGAGFLSVDVAAQCRPDGLDFGPCCTTTQPDIPIVPVFRQDVFGICWRDCDVEDFQTCRAEWTVPATSFNPCANQRMDLSIKDAAGGTKWKGRMRLQYSRTWQETDATGVQIQVWRFLVNGDLRPTAAAGLMPCPVPPCADDFGNRVRYTGYLDYAKDCFSPRKQFAWMLTHSCDAIDHAPGFARAGFFHFNRSYTFVGPSTSFAIGPIQPVASGGTSLEGVRRRPRTAAGFACEFEEQIDCGLEVLQELCICGFPTAPFQYAISDLGLGSSCGTSIFTPGGPYLPGYVSMGIGSWIDPGRYPGVETLRWNSGGYDYFDPCAGTTRQEVFFGVTTIGGYAAATIPSGGGAPFPLPRTFVDQCNSLSPAGATRMNVRFESDHFLNLNFD